MEVSLKVQQLKQRHCQEKIGSYVSSENSSPVFGSNPVSLQSSLALIPQGVLFCPVGTGDDNARIYRQLLQNLSGKGMFSNSFVVNYR
jgi:hypothetical protein